MKKRGYPKYVSECSDRHGRVRLRYRLKGAKPYYFKATFGTKDFEIELAACRSGQNIEPIEIVSRVAPGTISFLLDSYFAGGSFKAGSAITQRKNRGILETLREKHGNKRVASMQFEHVDAIITQKADHFPAAARNLRKQLRRLFEHAVKLRMRADNPVDLTQNIKSKPGAKGFHAWSEAEIAQYRDYHKIGTKPRLAMELLLWTALRRSDVVRIGPRDIQKGRLVIETEKTGKVLHLLMAPQLIKAIRAMSVIGHETYLVTAYGKPFTVAGFGLRFKSWCMEAGLPHCTPHGLRKAMARRGAELGGTNQQLKAVGGWVRDEEVTLYTASASQSGLADIVITSVAEWEAKSGT